MRWRRGAQRSTKAEDGASSFVVSDDEEESGGDLRLLELGYVSGGVALYRRAVVTASLDQVTFLNMDEMLTFIKLPS